MACKERASIYCKKERLGKYVENVESQYEMSQKEDCEEFEKV